MNLSELQTRCSCPVEIHNKFFDLIQSVQFLLLQQALLYIPFLRNKELNCTGVS